MCFFRLATSVIALTILATAEPRPTGLGNGTAIPIVKRSRLVNADKTVDLYALNSHVESVKAKIFRGLNNFEKNTGKRHHSAVKGIERRGIGFNLGDVNEIWYGVLAVGTPPTYFTVQLDTSSSDLFIPASTCDWTCNGHTLWDPASSSTSGDLDQIFVAMFGDGNWNTVAGEQYTDTVAIGTFTATTQTIGAATSYPPWFQSSQYPADGLMGMAFPSISTYGLNPVFQTFISEGQMTDPVFSFKLESAKGQLYIGGSNSELYTGSFSYTPVTQQGFWEVNMDNIQANGKIVMNEIDCIIDTGSKLIIGPPSDVSALYSAIGGKDAPVPPGGGFYIFPCDSFPTLSFTFGGTPFQIAPSLLNIGPVSAGSSDCVSGIVGFDLYSSFWVVGDIFLQNVYTTFDVGNALVGFAHLA